MVSVALVPREAGRVQLADKIHYDCSHTIRGYSHTTHSSPHIQSTPDVAARHIAPPRIASAYLSVRRSLRTPPNSSGSGGAREKSSSTRHGSTVCTCAPLGTRMEPVSAPPPILGVPAAIPGLGEGVLRGVERCGVTHAGDGEGVAVIDGSDGILLVLSCPAVVPCCAVVAATCSWVKAVPWINSVAGVAFKGPNTEVPLTMRRYR